MDSYDANKVNIVTIGYYDDNSVYLLPTETWHAVQQFCKQEDSHFPFSRSTFFKLLMARGVIASTPNGPTIQKKINKVNHRVLKLIGGGIYENFVTSVTDDTTN